MVAPPELQPPPPRDIRGQWHYVMQEVARRSATVHALLRTYRLESVEARVVTVSVTMRLAETLLADPRRRRLVEDSIETVVGEPYTFRCIAGT